MTQTTKTTTPAEQPIAPAMRNLIFEVTFRPETGLFVMRHKHGGLVPNRYDLGYSKEYTFSQQENAEAWAQTCHDAYQTPKFVHPATPYVSPKLRSHYATARGKHN